MRQVAIILALCSALTGCMKAQHSTSKALDDVEEGTSTTWGKVREALDLSSPAKAKARHPQPRYCYKTYEDILCYSKPQPDQESRLVAYQAGNVVGYTMEPPPEPRSVIAKKVLLPQKMPKATSAPVQTAAPAASSDAPVPAPTATPAPLAATQPPAGQSTKTDQKKLKEIIFDPSELEPKKLVPDKAE